MTDGALNFRISLDGVGGTDCGDGSSSREVQFPNIGLLRVLVCKVNPSHWVVQSLMFKSLKSRIWLEDHVYNFYVEGTGIGLCRLSSWILRRKNFQKVEVGGGSRRLRPLVDECGPR